MIISKGQKPVLSTVWKWVLVAQPCLTFFNPMSCSLSGFSVRGILQARILEWIAAPSSRGSSQPRDGTCDSYVSCFGKWVLFAVKTSHFWSIVCFVQWDFCHASLKSSVSGVLVYPCECSHWLWKQFFIVLGFCFSPSVAAVSLLVFTFYWFMVIGDQPPFFLSLTGWPP